MVNNLIVALSLFLVLSGCEEDNRKYPPRGYICDDGYIRCLPKDLKKLTCDNSKQAAFIINCAKAANPLSDEEGEDLVAQCERTSEHLFCKTEAMP